MPDPHPQPITPALHVEPVPRRIRAMAAGHAVVDTRAGRYVWEHPWYPTWYLPDRDVATDLLVDGGGEVTTDVGTFATFALAVDGTRRTDAARRLTDSAVEGLEGWWRLDWASMDRWFEEDEQVFVHPRSPYVRIDAIASSRHVRVELDGTVLAETRSPVLLFETGLPTRTYLPITDVDLDVLVASPTVTSCPYKGTTDAYWHARVGDHLVEDVAWSYAFPTRQAQPIAGHVAFYDDRVDVLAEDHLR